MDKWQRVQDGQKNQVKKDSVKILRQAFKTALQEIKVVENRAGI